MNAIRQLEEVALKHGYESWSFLHDNRGLTDLDETSRLFTLQSESRRVITSSGPRKASDVVRKQVDEDTKPGEQEVSRFLRLLDVIHTVPWANKAFEVNNGILRQLMCGHLELIVGPEVAKAHGQRLRQLIDLDAKDSHLVWVTNRQQGKTTTICKFLTALAVASTRGGNLAFVYSTSLDRAQEVLRGVKAMLRWLIKKKVLHTIGYTNVRLVRDNEIMFGLETGGVENVMRARPRTLRRVEATSPRPWWSTTFSSRAASSAIFAPPHRSAVGPLASSPPPRARLPGLRTISSSSRRPTTAATSTFTSSPTRSCAPNARPTGSPRNARTTRVRPPEASITLHNMLKLVPASGGPRTRPRCLGPEDKTDAYIDSRLMAALLEVPRPPTSPLFIWRRPAARQSNIGLAAFASDTATGQLIFLGSASVNLMRAEKIQCDMVSTTFRRMHAQRPLAEPSFCPSSSATTTRSRRRRSSDNPRQLAAHAELMSAKQYGKYIT